MAYFGRKDKKPQSTPGSGSGFAQERREVRVERAVGALLSQSRPGRPARMSKAVRASRAGRSGRSAR
jgi:hypothetical protein